MEATTYYVNKESGSSENSGCEKENAYSDLKDVFRDCAKTGNTNIRVIYYRDDLSRWVEL